MIIVRLQGGLGNQMFQYAFGKMLAKKNNTVLKIDTALLGSSPHLKNAVVRHFDLDIFTLTLIFAEQKEINYFNGFPNGSVLKRIFFKISKTLQPRNLLIQQKHIFNEQHLNAPDNTCIVGRWQSEKYFKDAANDVIADFEIKEEWLLKSSYTNEIKSTENCVSIHVRREDFVLDENKKEIRQGLGYETLSIDYYKNAIEYIKLHVSNPHFFIFSEDMEWSEKHLNFIPNAVFVKTEKTKKGMAEDLNLIRLCNHHITSNSTFSWWGAYLCKNKTKIIVAPSKWSTQNDEFNPPHIIPEGWIKI